MFILIEKQTLILKNSGKWNFFFGTKASIHSFQWGEWIGGAQSLKEKRLLYESVFVQLDGWKLILKIVEKEVFLINPKHQYHLSQREECVYGL